MPRASRWRAGMLGLGLGLAGCGRTEILLAEDDAGPGPNDGMTTDAVCGDGVAEGEEVCDGSDLRGGTCEGLGLGGGVLRCGFGCQELDLDGCALTACGNGIRDGGETCDGNDLGGQTCASLGLEGGTLACSGDCQGFDLSSCLTTLCGNGIRDGGEECDGADLGGVTCERLVGEPGQLVCTPDCQGFDLLGCGDACADSDLGTAVGPAVATGSTVSEDDDLPQGCAADGGRDHVLSFTATAPGVYAFDTLGSSYDTALAIFGSCHPGSQLACNDDTPDSVQSRLELPLDADQRVFVSVDGFAGDVGDWVLSIAPPTIPSAPACTEEDLLWTTGQAVATGNTTVEDDDLEQACNPGPSVDHVLRFIAPSSGSFQFDTVGSDFDTVLSIHSGCTPGSELGCNDDFNGLTSQVTLDLTAGQSVLVMVSGYSGDTGPWVLSIEPA